MMKLTNLDNAYSQNSESFKCVSTEVLNSQN